MLNFDCVVIGAGIAGMTASLYLKRAGISVLLLEKSAPGGQVNRTPSIENYPGIIKIDGPTFAMTCFEQIMDIGVLYHYGTVTSIEDKGLIKIITTDMEQISTKTIILALGRSPRELHLPNEKSLTGRGVSWCALCDGPLFKNQEVAIVGGGNSALEEALYLSQICTKVTLINRSNTLRAEQILQDKIKEKSNIIIRYNTEVMKLNEDDNKLSSIVLKSKNKVENYPISGLFLSIGYTPDTVFLEKMNLKLKDNYIVVNEEMKTNIPGVFACGDVIFKDVYQISTAIGEAATASVSVIKYLKNT